MPQITISRKASQPSDNTVPPLAVSVREAARLLGVSEKSVRNWTAQGKLHARRIGGRVLYSMKELETFLASDSATDMGSDDEKQK